MLKVTTFRDSKGKSLESQLDYFRGLTTVDTVPQILAFDFLKWVFMGLYFSHRHSLKSILNVHCNLTIITVLKVMKSHQTIILFSSQHSWSVTPELQTPGANMTPIFGNHNP